MKCPNCGGTDLDKERILGMDTGDKKCCDCGYVGMSSSFPEEDISTLTGRKPSVPNLQNVPIRTELGTKNRDAFSSGRMFSSPNAQSITKTPVPKK